MMHHYGSHLCERLVYGSRSNDNERSDKSIKKYMTNI